MPWDVEKAVFEIAQIWGVSEEFVSEKLKDNFRTLCLTGPDSAPL
jgi:hypothetical protein